MMQSVWYVNIQKSKINTLLEDDIKIWSKINPLCSTWHVLTKSVLKFQAAINNCWEICNNDKIVVSLRTVLSSTLIKAGVPLLASWSAFVLCEWNLLLLAPVKFIFLDMHVDDSICTVSSSTVSHTSDPLSLFMAFLSFMELDVSLDDGMSQILLLLGSWMFSALSLMLATFKINLCRFRSFTKVNKVIKKNVMLIP